MLEYGHAHDELTHLSDDELVDMVIADMRGELNV